MTVTTGWDAFVLAIKPTPDGTEVRVGAIFLAALVWLAHRALVRLVANPDRSD